MEQVDKYQQIRVIAHHYKRTSTWTMTHQQKLLLKEWYLPAHLNIHCGGCIGRVLSKLAEELPVEPPAAPVLELDYHELRAISYAKAEALGIKKPRTKEEMRKLIYGQA